MIVEIIKQDECMLCASIFFLNPIISYVSVEHFRSLGTHIKEIGEYLEQLESAKAQYFEAVLPNDHMGINFDLK